MSKRDEKFVNQTRRKLSCDLVDCASNITFTVSEFEYLKYKSRVRGYIGQCDKCHCSIKLSSAGYNNFLRLFGSTKLVVIKENFDSLFDVDADK